MKNLEFVEVLQQLGIKKNVALMITHLKDVKNASSKDIQTATGLRQPEICIAVCTLRDMGWVTEQDITKNGKGRRLEELCSTTDHGGDCQIFEDQKAQEAARTRETFHRLKELSTA